MASKCTKCGSEDNYNFALNIGMCNVCITKELEQLKILREDIISGRVMIVEVEHYEKLDDNLNTAYGRIKELEGIYNHPNHDDPKERYLYDIRCAIKLLREFSGMEGGGEYAFGVAVQLDQFYKRARQALKAK